MDVGFLGVEVFVERGSDHTIWVDCDPKFFNRIIDVGIVSNLNQIYFLSPPSFEKINKFPPF